MSNLAYIPQFDALRALAIIMTILVHYFEIPFMYLGVDLFFAISGFLITSILLKSKANDVSIIVKVKNFIIRRLLRLLPAYYLYLLFFWLLATFTTFDVGNKAHFLYHFTYTSNYLMFFHFNEVYTGFFGHLWSLSIEEQFYLFWPWFILLIPIRFIKYSLIIIVLIGLISRAVMIDGQGVNVGVRFLPNGDFHTLGVGAVLAYFWHFQHQNMKFIKLKNNAKIYFLVSFILFIGCIMLFPSSTNEMFIYKLYKQLVFCSLLFFLLLSTLMEWKYFIGYLANHKITQYIGRISYGIYLYHMPLPYFVNLTLERTNLGQLNVFTPYISCIIAFLIASFSFKFIESPFLRFKQKYN